MTSSLKATDHRLRLTPLSARVVGAFRLVITGVYVLDQVQIREPILKFFEGRTYPWLDQIPIIPM
ncbi:hypothetical protein A5790_13160 [Mycobacterium sp. 852002-51152_SCH6134967]|uniref:hypothetical protein n=1 Tax=Mycobacterium sp. 852002-51152_SCH6134967 TaxID=1834096 RepID=UPI0007FDD82C|nr:hypothetical protein [Mycobacterium sp. 852002-51152_SCH6134967]OBF92783.1 hypothetical protein A5790_13160 [Mycobacterium sp. 852002-51152_SCH6134967]